MATFLLMHGACHGAWCWEAVAPLLHERGHEVVAPDLPCDDVDAGLEEYAELCSDAMAGVSGDVVVVGHSLGALTASVVAARREVSVWSSWRGSSVNRDEVSATDRAMFEEWPRCEIVSIVCSDDRVVNPVWSRQVSLTRLGVQPVEMAGGHSPFFTRPGDLSAVLMGGLGL